MGLRGECEAAGTDGMARLSPTLGEAMLRLRRHSPRRTRASAPSDRIRGERDAGDPRQPGGARGVRRAASVGRGSWRRVRDSAAVTNFREAEISDGGSVRKWRKARRAVSRRDGLVTKCPIAARWKRAARVVRPRGRHGGVLWCPRSGEQRRHRRCGVPSPECEAGTTRRRAGRSETSLCRSGTSFGRTRSARGAR